MNLNHRDDFHFLIIGCQRSGTTLMRLILECHPSVQCFDENMAFKVLEGTVQPLLHRPLVGLKVPQLTEQMELSSLKKDLYYQEYGNSDAEIPNRYENQKLIFMIRDSRDTVASMLKLGNWLEKYGGPVLDFKMTKDEKFIDRYIKEINYVNASPFPRVARASLIWKYKMDALFDYLQSGYPILPVWYESLVKEPDHEILRLCAFLQIPWEDSMLKHSERSHYEMRYDGRAIGNTNPKRAIDSRSVGQWKQFFDIDQLSEINKIVGHTQSLLYRDIP